MLHLWLVAFLLLPQDAALEKDGVRLSLKAAPSFGEEALARVRDNKGAEEIGRVAFARRGWFMNADLPAGDYRLVIEAPRRALRLCLRSESGALAASDSFWITPPNPALPKPELTDADGAVLLTIACGDIRFSWRYVPRDKLDALATGKVSAGKRVELVSDLRSPELEAALVRETDASVELQSALIGRPPPAEPIRIYLFREEKAYAAVDQLVTGGRFKRNGGFASPLTRQAYFWYASRLDPPDLVGVGAPLILRATLLHEFHHVLCYTLRPECTVWPSWLIEGLAEKAAADSLRACKPADDADFREYMKGRWRHSESVGSLPTLEDLLGAYAGADLGGWYSSAFQLVDRLEPEKLKGLLEALSAEELTASAATAAREYLDHKAGGARSLWTGLRDDLLRGAAPPLSVLGQTDRTTDGFRLISSENGSGRLILQEKTFGPDVTLEATFAWQPAGERQADFYLAYAAGKEVVTFLKVAILPRRIALFRFNDNRWTRWGQKEFDEPLAESGEKKAWHPAILALKGKERSVTVQVEKWKADFPLLEYVPTEDTKVGLGVYNGTVTFKDVRAK
jgi:hypothetical protein